MSDVDQVTPARGGPDAARRANRPASSRTVLPPGLPPGAEVPPLVPDHDLDEDSAPPRRPAAPLRLAAAVTAVAVLGALVIGVSGRSAIGETPPQRPGVGGQVVAAERAQTNVPAAGGQAGAPDSLTNLVIELDGSGQADLVVGSTLGIETLRVSLPYRGSLSTSSGSAAATQAIRVTATARTPGSSLRCRLLNGDRVLKAASAQERVDCSIRGS
ncbi:hypothetical protein BA895_08940 [Humibacillus sp. DSM 29435]|uniref:hypothetical protein n=1 Tax=Humibacillus sp. DSM 29435 TaxID=1869167 RepID=UPI000872C621|nr:hypothetical protein [Humibacillus sp. DSM 29435]OFE14792.1 hypothetical protein BA895_08940 [Humibacillus sp. DSM 29435]